MRRGAVPGSDRASNPSFSHSWTLTSRLRDCVALPLWREIRQRGGAIAIQDARAGTRHGRECRPMNATPGRAAPGGRRRD